MYLCVGKEEGKVNLPAFLLAKAAGPKLFLGQEKYLH